MDLNQNWQAHIPVSHHMYAKVKGQGHEAEVRVGELLWREGHKTSLMFVFVFSSIFSGCVSRKLRLTSS